ncbi:carbohydrate kinase [Methylobacillus gramineus]|uniref:carbohydrate kinase family protein n=1 Tax=Methylobacillus gramineus TaxID=755169 RepID=UPI001CFF9AF3|nr:carbohydrate kinase [Methylobacillus gramineus]MCB5185846.1 carbohydrate kinase [Methylobacillus gramineus]
MALNKRNFKQENGHAVAIFGEVLADIFPDGSVLGGAPFNVARHLHAFGLHPVMITRIGHDALGQELLDEMTHLGMDTTGVQADPIHPTGQVKVHMADDGHRFEILPSQAYDYINAGVTHMVTMSTKPDLVYFGTLAQRNMEARLALDNFLNYGTSPRFLDINLRDPWYDKHTVRRSLLRADIVKMNDDELDVLASMLRLPGKTALEYATAMLKRFNLDMILVTAGAEGAWILNKDGKVTEITGSDVPDPFMDTVGAGDGFASAYILGILKGWPIELTLQRANQFAAALCTIRGAAPSSADFYLPFLKEWQS